ncbi:Serine/threonine-protein kinase OSR1 [Durusdinium trenchii]|uniref:Serine/threonine-protein kinase OSR1 n=1 Tax=Durusdinium trenchii TaxID=1381693 RepID=A0ABP0IJU9_9DINO
MKIIIEKDPPKANRKLSHLFLDLIEMCLQKDPKKRPTMEEVCARNAKFFRTADVTVLRTHTFDCPMLFLHVKKHTRAVTPLLLLNQVTMVRWSTCNKPGVNLLFGNSHPLIGPLLHTFDRTVTTPPDVSSPPRPSR